MTKAIKSASLPLTAPKLSLRANFSWIFVGNVIYAASQWGMLVALAKLGSTQMVGQFALGLAVTGPIIMFASLKMRDLQATDARNDYTFADYLGIRLATSALALLLIVGVAVLLNYPFETRLVIMAVGVAKVIESISDVVHGLLQAQERMDRIAISLMIRGPLSLAGLALGVYLTGSVFWGVVGLVLAWALVLFLYDLRSAIWIMKRIQQAQTLPTGRWALRPRWNLHTMTGLFWLALPLGFVEMLCSLQDSISRFFVDTHLGASALGIFAALAYFGRTGDLVVHALGHSASPSLSRYYVGNDRTAFRSLMLRLVALGAGLGAGAILISWLLGAPIVSLVYRPEYVRQDVFIPLMLAFGLNYVAKFMIYVLTAARYLRHQMFLELSVTASLILFSAWLIPLYGLSGAAWAMVIGCAMEGAGALMLSMRAVSALKEMPKTDELLERSS